MVTRLSLRIVTARFHYSQLQVGCGDASVDFGSSCISSLCCSEVYDIFSDGGSLIELGTQSLGTYQTVQE